MSTVGATRTCPHCRAVILESSVVCPACRHHLRAGVRGEEAQGEVAFAVEGTVTHPSAQLEYQVVVVVRNARGEEIARKVVDVGGMAAGDHRTVDLSVVVLPR